jgi:eukaryotic translation initiation factor 2-alpha kinase 4
MLALLNHDSHNQHYYKNGITFQVLHDNNKKDESMIAAGGRYDSLIQQFRYPVGVSGSMTGKKPVYAVGVNIAVQKIINACVHHQASVSKSLAARSVDEEKAYGIWMPKKVSCWMICLDE